MVQFEKMIFSIQDNKITGAGDWGVSGLMKHQLLDRMQRKSKVFEFAKGLQFAKGLLIQSLSLLLGYGVACAYDITRASSRAWVVVSRTLLESPSLRQSKFTFGFYIVPECEYRLRQKSRSPSSVS